MDITRTLYVAKRKDWRDWLKKHYKTEKEIWLVYYKKQSGKPRIPYEDAVEEALCFGWIDSTVKPLDDERYAQRFSPRNPKSAYSQPNKERLRRLARQGKVKKGSPGHSRQGPEGKVHGPARYPASDQGGPAGVEELSEVIQRPTSASASRSLTEPERDRKNSGNA